MPGEPTGSSCQTSDTCKIFYVGKSPLRSSHSFRRGLSTSAAREQIDFELIKKQGGWKSDATVWEYIEEGQQLSNNAALKLLEKISGILESQKSECND